MNKKNNKGFSTIGFEEFLSWQGRHRRLTINKGNSADEAKVYGFLEHNENRLKKLIHLLQRSLPQIHSFNSAQSTLNTLQTSMERKNKELSAKIMHEEFSGKILLRDLFDRFFDVK